MIQANQQDNAEGHGSIGNTKPFTLYPIKYTHSFVSVLPHCRYDTSYTITIYIQFSQTLLCGGNIISWRINIICLSIFNSVAALKWGNCMIIPMPVKEPSTIWTGSGSPNHNESWIICLFLWIQFWSYSIVQRDSMGMVTDMCIITLNMEATTPHSHLFTFYYNHHFRPFTINQFPLPWYWSQRSDIILSLLPGDSSQPTGQCWGPWLHWQYNAIDTISHKIYTGHMV